MIGFTIGLRSLRAAQVAMNLVGQNVANASTPGYSRRQVSFAPSAPMLGRFALGTGVEVRELRRIHDSLVDTRLREQRQVLGQLETSGSLLGQLEGFFQEPSDSGLAARLDDLWNAFSDVASSADDSSFRDGLVQAALTLGAGFRQVASQVESVGDEARQGVDFAVGVVNGYLSEIAALNDRIVKARSYGSAPSDLLDARDEIVKQLSDWVDPQVLERPDGTVDVLIDGMLMASGDRARELVTRQPGDGTVEVLVKDSLQKIDIGGGRLAGYLGLAHLTVPSRRAELDELAKSLIYEINKRHTTAVPATGPYTQLSAAVTVAPGDVDQPLSALDLPFQVKEGRLTVNVVESATGSVTQHFLDVDPESMSLADLAGELDALHNVSASLDSVGRLRVGVAAGFGFDFSARLDVDPDDAGSFGSDHATLTTGTGPFALADGDTLDLAVDGGIPLTVTFSAADFADIGNATAEEVAAVLKAQAPGITALAADGRIVVRSDTAGTSSSLQVTAASSSALFAVGTTDIGTDTAVAVNLTGAPSDGQSGHFTVRALGDGVIGLTPGLAIGLFDQSGTQLASFDVGSGYVPGDPIELVPGVSLTLSAGTVGASSGDVFEFDLVDDPDSSDALVALQLGAFFTGSGAADLDVDGEIVADPRKVAGSRSGSAGDASAFTALVALRDEALESLSGRTIAQGYGELVASVGLDVRTNFTATLAQAQLLQSLESRREEISGVNTDEEMLKLLEYQHLYQAAGRYLQTVSQMTDVLFGIV
ncbi:MAG: flagellar hook-associated protein FlgK [Planctomycetes bacterium]|nr:flagellar hook-associated protein FlgK [Planctomycetota bacterium]